MLNKAVFIMKKISLWIMFVTSVWALIGLCGFRAVTQYFDATRIVDGYPGGYGIKVLLAPFILLGFELTLWLKLFRYNAHPARLFSGLMGINILIIIFINLIVADLYDRNINYIELLILCYSSLGHLAYALFGKESYDFDF